MKAFEKSVFRSFKTNISRFLSILLIVLVGVAFVSGIGTLSHIMKVSCNDEFVSYQGADITLKSRSVTGFSEEEISSLSDEHGIKSLRKIKVYDKDDTRIIIIDSLENETNHLTLLKGEEISSPKMIYCDQFKDEMNEKVTLFDNNEYEVCGVIANPLYYSKDKEYTIEGKEIKHFYYAEESYFPSASYLPYTDLWVCLDDVSSMNIFSSSYQEKVDEMSSYLCGKYNVACLTYEENVSYQLIINYAEKIDVISWIFPVFFVLVSSLVVLTTMSRLIEEERGIIGTYRTLGYSSFRILTKYLLFSLTSCIVGSLMGILLGIFLLPYFIYPAFDALFFMPAMPSSRNISYGLIAMVFTIVSVLLVTVYSSFKELMTKPSELLRPKAPKPGKKIFLEFIPFLWKGLKFRYKSSFRNVFRYVKHLLMTVVSISGSTALVLAGFGLYNCVMSPDEEKLPSSMSDSFGAISVMIIIFAAVLCVLVIYNLTNMNISERNREIATLKVLGYQNGEVGFYIYREVTIMTVIGIIFGLPLGYLLCDFVFTYLDMGGVNYIKVSSYFFTAGLVLVFLFITDFLLYPKIKKVDMNQSLKSNE